MSKYQQYHQNSRLPAHKVKAWIEKNFQFKTRKGGQEYLINNPFTHDTDFKFNINPVKGKCHCWTGDEWAGPVNPVSGRRNCSFIKFVQLYLKCSYREAIETVVGVGVDSSYYLKPENRITDSASENIITVELPKGSATIADATDIQANMVKRWLKSRGYTDETISKDDIHYLSVDAIWPYFEFDTLVYWQSRSLLNKQFLFPDKNVYDNSGNKIGETEGSKGEFLYGFDNVDYGSYVIIVEAIFGRVTLGENVVASGGAALTQHQVSKIKILSPKRGIILAPDNDKAGLKSLISNYDLLESYGYKVYFSVPPKLEYKDSDGKACYTKDWNELYTGCGISLSEIRSIHDKNISAFTLQSKLKILSLISGM